MIDVDARLETLAGLALFDGLPRERLRWILAQSRERRIELGEDLFSSGGEPEFFFLELEGRFELARVVAGERVVFNDHHAPTYAGGMNLLMETPYPASARAVEPSLVLCLPKAAFFELVFEHRGVMREILRQIGPNYQLAGAVIAQQEKLAALGQVAAGLAHEINNPASAARRAAGQLRTTLATLQGGLGQACTLGAAGVESLLAAAEEAVASSRQAEPVGSLEAADRADALATRLEARGVEGAWEHADTLAATGVDDAWLDRLASRVAAERLGPALGWVAASVEAGELLDELEASVRRVTDLVAAIKEYSYMDRAPRQEVDVHDGLESTLTILGHKLRGANVAVERAYDRSLPRITALGSQLNQVWTNLLDNAIDAAPGGHVSIETGRVGDRLRVAIADDGAGIPEDLHRRIFEPFFTTKDVGAGTGLGLDVAWRIVTEGHGGEIRVASEPGRTRFEVLLPTS